MVIHIHNTKICWYICLLVTAMKSKIKKTATFCLFDHWKRLSLNTTEARSRSTVPCGYFMCWLEKDEFFTWHHCSVNTFVIVLTYIFSWTHIRYTLEQPSLPPWQRLLISRNNHYKVCFYIRRISKIWNIWHQFSCRCHKFMV